MCQVWYVVLISGRQFAALPETRPRLFLVTNGEACFTPRSLTELPLPGRHLQIETDRPEAAQRFQLPLPIV